MKKINEAIIINSKPILNTSAILTVITDQSEILSGLCKGAMKKNNSFHIGNLISLSWFGKENALGIISAENIKSYANIMYLDRDLLKNLILITTTLYKFFPENTHIKNSLFYDLKELFEAIIKYDIDKLQINKRAEEFYKKIISDFY